MIYLVGPMGSTPGWEKWQEAFYTTGDLWRVKGHEVFNPWDVPYADDLDGVRLGVELIAAKKVDRVLTIGPWWESRGARLEVHVAVEFGIPVEPA